MMPSPPALETADASWLRAIQPIGACTIGYFTPVWASTRFIRSFSVRRSRQVARAFVGGGEIGWRVGPAGQRPLGVGVVDEVVAQARRAGILDDHAVALGTEHDMARRRQMSCAASRPQAGGVSQS